LHYMEMNGQIHASATWPPGKNSGTYWCRDWVGARTGTDVFGGEIIFDWAFSLVAVLTTLLWLLLMYARTMWNKISTYLEYIPYHFCPSQSSLWVCISLSVNLYFCTVAWYFCVKFEVSTVVSILWIWCCEFWQKGTNISDILPVTWRWWQQVSLKCWYSTYPPTTWCHPRSCLIFFFYSLFDAH